MAYVIWTEVSSLRVPNIKAVMSDGHTTLGFNCPIQPEGDSCISEVLCFFYRNIM